MPPAEVEVGHQGCEPGGPRGCQPEAREDARWPPHRGGTRGFGVCHLDILDPPLAAPSGPVRGASVCCPPLPAWSLRLLLLLLLLLLALLVELLPAILHGHRDRPRIIIEVELHQVERQTKCHVLRATALDPRLCTSEAWVCGNLAFEVQESIDSRLTKRFQNNMSLANQLRDGAETLEFAGWHTAAAYTRRRSERLKDPRTLHRGPFRHQ